MKKLALLPYIILIAVLGTFTTVVSSQADRCPVIVQEALARVDTVCDALGRNELCYGNTLNEAWDADGGSLPFENDGDIIDLDGVNSLTTYPLNVDDETWGVAVMSVQADLPDTSPGQNVTFIVFGDTQVEALGTATLTLDVVAPQNLNLRTGPSTDFARAGLLEAGATAKMIARNDAGDWVRLANEENQSQWVFAPLLETDADIASLPIADEAAAFSGYDAPMQAFRFTSGVGRPACAEAPRDGVLIQTPSGLTANFLINGVQMSVGSTALVRLGEEDELNIANLQGDVIVNSNGLESELTLGANTAITGEETDFLETSSVNLDDVQGLQEVVNVLPEPFEIPLDLHVVSGSRDGVNCLIINVPDYAKQTLIVEGLIGFPSDAPLKFIGGVNSGQRQPDSPDYFANFTEIYQLDGQTVPQTEYVEPFFSEFGRYQDVKVYEVENPGPGQYLISFSRTDPGGFVTSAECTLTIVEPEYES